MEIKTLGLSPDVCKFITEKKRDIEFDNLNEKGATGLILFGFHNLLKKRVALKFYYYENGVHEEVELLASIKNENILVVLDAGIINNKNAFFMTDEISAGDLDDLLATKKFSYRQAINITRGILNGLVEMHNSTNRLLHRDLKPANILLSKADTPLIADFGSVKRIPDECDAINASRHAALYRAPEAFDNFYTYSSDLYQVGLVLYQLLGGYLPYEEFAYLNNKQKIQYTKLTSNYDKSKFVDNAICALSKKRALYNLNTLPPYVDEKVKSIIRKATSPCYKSRYSSCSEFIHALHELGLVEDWNLEDGKFSLNSDNKIFKIVNQGKGKFACMKSLDSGLSWRREVGIVDNSETKIVYELKKKLRR